MRAQFLTTINHSDGMIKINVMAETAILFQKEYPFSDVLEENKLLEIIDDAIENSYPGIIKIARSRVSAY